MGHGREKSKMSVGAMTQTIQELFRISLQIKIIVLRCSPADDIRMN